MKTKKLVFSSLNGFSSASSSFQPKFFVCFSLLSIFFSAFFLFVVLIIFSRCWNCFIYVHCFLCLLSLWRCLALEYFNLRIQMQWGWLFRKSFDVNFLCSFHFLVKALSFYKFCLISPEKSSIPTNFLFILNESDFNKNFWLKHFFKILWKLSKFLVVFLDCLEFSRAKIGEISFSLFDLK